MSSKEHGRNAPEGSAMVLASTRARTPFEILAKPNVVKVPRAAPFIADESDANAWGIPTCIRYLKEIIELPQYEESFLRFEVNGLAFLCLAKDVIPQLNIQNTFHSAKIALHADKLRQKVFDKAAVSLPDKIEDWDVVHVGAWLAVHMALPAKGLKALRSAVDGMKLLEMTEEELKIFLNTTLDDDLSSRLHSLIETGRYGTRQVKEYLDKVGEDRVRPQSKKRSKTAMAQRLQRAIAEQENSADNDHVSPPSYEASQEGTSVMSIPIVVDGKKKAPGPNLEGDKKPSSGSLSKTVTFISPEKLNPESREKVVTKSSALSKLPVVVEQTDGAHTASGDVSPEPKSDCDEEAESEEETEVIVLPATKQKLPKKAPTVVYIERSSEPRPSESQLLERDHNAYLTKVLGHVVESNKATVGSLQQIIQQLSEDKRRADEELLKARAAAMDSTVALGLLRKDKDNALDKIENLIRSQQVVAPAPVKENQPAGPDDTLHLSDDTRGFDKTTESLIVMSSPHPSRPDANNSTGNNASSQQPYRTYVNVLSPKKTFLGDDFNVSMEETMMREAIAEKGAWMQCLDMYTNMETMGTEYNESRMILSETAIVWIKVGNQMLRDSAKGYAYDSGPPKEVRRCLLGLRSCVSAALSSEDRSRNSRSVSPSNGSEVVHRPSCTPLKSKKGDAVTTNGTIDNDRANVENVSELAVGMVYALGLIRKIIGKHGTRADTMNLSFLLRKARHGDLPLSELSRDDLRALLTDFLNIDFSKWHKLEAVCQLLDPDRNGFVDLSSILRSFHSLCPLLESMYGAPRLNKVTAQRLCLVVLTIACEDLASRGKDFNRVLSEIISTRCQEVASFRDFMLSEAFTGNKTKHESESSDVVRMQDIEVIADLLFEFTAHFFTSHSGTEPLSLSLSPWPMIRQDISSSPSKYSRLPHGKASCNDMTDIIRYLTSHLRDVCTEVARSFRIYMSDSDNALRRPVLTSVATLFVTYMCFRRSILERSGSSADSTLSPYIQQGAIEESVRRDSMHPSMLLLPQHALVLAEGIEQQVYSVLGNERASAALAKSDCLSPEDFELVMAQLISIPIPVGRGQSVGLALSACQLDVEGYLLEVTGPGYMKSPRVVPKLPPHQQQRLDTRSLGRLQRTAGRGGKYTQELRSKDDAFISTRGGSNQRPMSQDPFSGDDDESAVSLYLESLNNDALELKRQLDHLLKLKQAAGLIKGSPGAIADKKNDINAVLNAVVKIYKSLEEAVAKAKDQPTPPKITATRMSLLEGLLDDLKGFLQEKLDVICSLEGHIGRGRTDALKMCSLIVTTLR